jgi:acetyl-CoA carboxylase carboxyl transferase alpha subunit
LESAVADVVIVLSPDSTPTTDTSITESKKEAEATDKNTLILDYTTSRSMTRPQCQDMIDSIFSHFVELKGDGRVGGDGCIRGGLAIIKGTTKRCVVVASFKGHTPSDMQAANYGMSSPAGYRKALRLMNIAERFGLPVITLVDTCGALPSFDAERDGQSEAIATNLTTMAGLSVPIITIVAGEGGSGGALGIGMGNVVGMLSSAYYGVISPEGAASILGRYKNDADKAKRFPDDCRSLATMQKIYAPQLKELGVIDQVIWDSGSESHNSFPTLANSITTFILESLVSLPSDPASLIEHRYNKFRKMGDYDLLNENERKVRVEEARNIPQPNRPPRTKPNSNKSRLLNYLTTRTLIGEYSAFKGRCPDISQYVADVPKFDSSKNPRPTRENAKTVLDRDGPEALALWVRERSKTSTLITDTTLRDAHQSLLATRVRTCDLLGAVPEASTVLHDAFSFEMWGGATFDVSYRFLSEDPWERLRLIREACPNVCLQMLIRGANAVGYTSYPDNVIIEFIKRAAASGMDVFRIFDCFNDLKQMNTTIQAVRACNKVAEVCICFTGDFLNTGKEKIYTLEYYKKLAKTIDQAGAHIIAIKDMAGLLKPGHARPLINAIREVSDKPIHFHTHSTSGVSLSSALAMVDAGCDIIDVAIASMSENTSQPNMNAFVASLQGHPRDTAINYLDLEGLDNYWKNVRVMYAPFENGMTSGSARVFDHQIPGGQYSNLMVQCKSMGLGSRWTEVLDMYRDVNNLFGDVVKVTPSSKCVGDLALYLINRKMRASDVLSKGDEIEFPQSTLDLCAGRLGFPHLGLPKELQRIVLKGEKPMTKRPGELMPSADFNNKVAELKELLGRAPSLDETLSSFLYAKVFKDCKLLAFTYSDDMISYLLLTQFLFYKKIRC